MSWNEYVESNYQELLTICKGLSDSPEDLLHYTFLRVYDKNPKNKEHYFKRALRFNSISRAFRKQFNQVWEELDNIPLEYDLDKRICIEKIDTVVRHLDSFDRAIFELYLQGENMTEISKESGIPIATIYHTLSKARQLIKENA